ncbi:hypothetical protein P5E86_15200, partial [Clostridium perfringens]|nr:hypothetical protein [Clostridium perfringens]
SARRTLVQLYLGFLLPQAPVSRSTPSKCVRNEEIRRRHAEGDAVRDLAVEFGISQQRVSQILFRRRA